MKFKFFVNSDDSQEEIIAKFKSALIEFGVEVNYHEDDECDIQIDLKDAELLRGRFDK